MYLLILPKSYPLFWNRVDDDESDIDFVYDMEPIYDIEDEDSSPIYNTDGEEEFIEEVEIDDVIDFGSYVENTLGLVKETVDLSKSVYHDENLYELRIIPFGR